MEGTVIIALHQQQPGCHLITANTAAVSNTVYGYRSISGTFGGNDN